MLDLKIMCFKPIFAYPTGSDKNIIISCVPTSRSYLSFKMMKFSYLLFKQFSIVFLFLLETKFIQLNFYFQRAKFYLSKISFAGYEIYLWVHVLVVLLLNFWETKFRLLYFLFYANEILFFLWSFY